MARPAARTRLSWLGSACVVALTAGAASAQDMPGGGQVVAGAATIGGATGAMVIKQTSGRAVIDWKSFGIGAGGRVTIDQPDAGSALLNRVTGGDLSKIAGNLSSNGQVFLVNRNGIVITPTGNIDTRGGFVGSTLDISNADFMAGRLRFGGAAGGMVLNQGRIAGGAIALLGANVANEGLIVSALGKVALGSGEQATLDLSGDGYLQVLVPANLADADGKPLVSNSGRIDGGYVVLSAATARTAVRQSVNMSGVITAKSVSGGGGVVLLDGGAKGTVTVSGAIDASGADQGGRIDITAGDAVTLAAATLTATGGTRGGLVRVGGMFQGGGGATAATAAQTERFVTRFGALPTLAAADTTTFDAASAIDVSGGSAGGTAILWSASATTQAGRINAGGGAVELSSHGQLTTNLSRVAAGAGGTLLLDPKDIWVADDNQFPGFYSATPLPAGGAVGYADAGADPATTYFKVGDVLAQMNAGTDVVLRASNDITWSADNAAVDFAFANGGRSGNLTLSAGRSVSLNGYLTLYSSSLTIIANDSAANGVVDADRDPGAASIDTFGAVVSAQTASSQTPGNISLTLGTGAGLTNHTIASSNRLGNISGGTVTLSTSGQASTWSFFPVQGIGATAVDVTAKGAIAISGSILAQANDGLTFSGTSVTWTDEAIRRVSNNAFGFVAFVENGVTTRYGIGSDGGGSNFTRVALGQGSAYAPIAYGDAAPTPTQYHITAGALRGTDTQATLATAFTNLATSGLPGAFAAPGSYAVATTATIDRANAPAGYFFDLRGASDALVINPKALLPTVTNGSYTYGAPSALVTLAGVLNNDAVTPVATLDATAGTALIANGGGFGFAATLAAGDHSFALTGLTGAGAGNYTLDTSGTVAATIAIARKALTYRIFDANAVYGTPGTTGSQLTGVVGADSVALASIGSSGFTTSAPVGTYAITGSGLSGTASANYLLAAGGNTDGVLTIQPKPVTYTAASGSSVYGDMPTVVTPTLAGIINNDAVAATLLLNGVASTLGQTSNAGSYGITAGLSGAGAGNYVIANGGNVAGTYTITRRPVGFAVTDVTTIYGTTAAVVTVTGLTGFDDARPFAQFDGDTLDLDSAGGTGYGVAAAGAGTHSFIFNGLRGAAVANYLTDLGGSARTATYTVTPKDLTYAITDLSRSFRTAAPLPTIALDGVIARDFGTVAGQLSVNGTAVTDPSELFALNAGTYSAGLTGLTGSAAANYRIATAGNRLGSYTVTPALIGYSLADASSVYGTAVTLPTPILTNTYFQDDVRGIVTVSQGGVGVTTGVRTPVGSYRLAVNTLAGANAGNYLVDPALPGATLTISPKTLTYAIGSASFVYGQAVAVPSSSLSGVVAGDTVTSTVGLSPSNIQGQPVYDLPTRFTVGDYHLGLRGIAGTDAGNYVVATSGNTNGALTITPKHLSYQIAATTVTYGDAPGLPTASLGGIETGDDVTPNRTYVLANGQAYTGPYGLPVGTYATSVFDLLGADSSNYVLDGAGGGGGTLSITRRPVASFVSLAGQSSSVVYGTYTPADTLVRAVVAGVLPSDASQISAVLVSPVLPASGAGLLAAGSYTYTASGITGAAAANYVFTGSNSATLTITPKPLGYAAYQTFTSTYGTAAAIGLPTLAGVIAGDAVASAGYAATSASGTTVAIGAQTAAGAYTVTASGLQGADAANYTAGAAATALTIAPKTITYATGDAGWVYGDTPTIAAARFTGLVGTDAVTGTRATPFTARTNVGSYTDAIVGLTGAAAANYILAASGNSDGAVTITPRALSFVASSNRAQTVAYLDPTQSFGALGGVLAGDAVTVQTLATRTGSSDTTPFDSTTVLPAASYIVGLQKRSATAYRLGGAAAANYTLAVTGQDSAGIGTLTVDKRALTYSATAPASAVYGDTVAYTLALAGAPQSYLAILNPFALVDGASYAKPQAAFTAGTHVIGAGLDDANFFLASGMPTTIAIAKRPLAYSFTTPASAIYGDTIDYGIRLQQAVPDTVQAEVTAALRIDGQAFADPQTGFTAGSHVLSVDLPLANYVLTGQPATIAIAKRALTYTLTAPSSGVYGDTLAYTTAIQGTVPDRVKAEATPTVQVDGRGVADPQAALTAGTHTLSLGLASSNFDFSGTGATVSITKRPLALTLLNASTVYGTNPDALVTLGNVARNDTFDIAVTMGGLTLGLNKLAAGYGAPSLFVSGFYRLDAGTYAVSLDSIGGSAIANYTVSTAGPGALTVTPKPLTYTIASVTGQYGGLTSPAAKGDPLQTDTGLRTAIVRLSGLISGDQGGISAGFAGVIVNGVTQAYTSTLAPGSYVEGPLGLSGGRAQNYTFATTGNTAGTLTLTPAVLRPQVSSGGRLYDYGDRTTYQLVDTPGEISYLRSYSAAGLVSPSDNVGVLVQVYKDGQPYTGTDFPVGGYELRPTALLGADANKYVFVGGGSGTLLVQDSSIFGFSFLTNTPNSVYAPPASVTTFTSSVNGGAGGTATATRGALSFVAGATGYGGASATMSYGVASLSTSVGAQAATMASFGPTGVTLGASAGLDASVTLSIGPASYTYGAQGSVSGTAVLDRTGVNLSTVANAGLYQDLTVAGDLGGGVSGSTTTSANLFAEARSTNAATYKDGQVVISERQWVGVGASAGTGGSISGGGVSGSASVTVYSPGSLGLGAASTSGYSNGTVTVGFTLAISIGIGGLEISPSFSFDAAGAVQSVSNAANDLGSALFGIGCNSGCRAAKAAQAAADQRTALFNQAVDLLQKNDRKPSVALMSFLAANPGVLSMAYKDVPDDKAGLLQQLQYANRDYGNIPDKLNTVVQQEQALARKLQANPGSLSFADMSAAQSLRAQEAQLIGQLSQLGGKVQVADGKISMVTK